MGTTGLANGVTVDGVRVADTIEWQQHVPLSAHWPVNK